MPERVYRVLLWAALFALMALIFVFSAQPGEASNSMTEAAVMPFAEKLASIQADGGEQLTEQLYLIIGTIVRKIAHLCEYALLGVLLCLLLRAYGLGMRWLPVLLGVAYAIGDEVHQTFVPGRLGTPVDVLIDTAGVGLGVLAVQWISDFRRKKHVHNQ